MFNPDKQMFPPEEWDCKEAFAFAGVKGFEPMLAKELETEEEQDRAFNDPDYIMEEKFDGTRSLMHTFDSHDGARQEFSEEMVDAKYIQLAYVLLEITKNESSEIKDTFLRASNDDVARVELMRYLREMYVNKSFSYTEEGTTVEAECGTQYIMVNLKVDEAQMTTKFTYRDSVDVIIDLIHNDCYGVNSGYCRLFSRRVSKKTGFFVENTDSLPQIRDLSFPELAGTVLDGEMFIDGLPFKEVSSTLNCLWDEAVRRQKEKGWVSIHVFDILFYKGIDVRRVPLFKRKELLKTIVDHINSPFVQYVHYQQCGGMVSVKEYVKTHGTIKELYDKLTETGKIESYMAFCKDVKELGAEQDLLSPRGFYEYIVATGGEGVIVKPVNGRYLHKRGWEYSKIKAFLTRDMVILGYTPPTEEYKGKFPDPEKWAYWMNYEHDVWDLSNATPEQIEEFKKHSGYPDECAPISKYEYMGWIGNLRLGVLISKVDYEKIPKSKRGETFAPSQCKMDAELDKDYYLMEVCTCAGYDEEVRADISNNRNEYIGMVVEVKANGIFADTGKLRHPRWMRFRYDKAPEDCTWEAHIGI